MRTFTMIGLTQARPTVDHGIILSLSCTAQASIEEQQGQCLRRWLYVGTESQSACA